jgi:ribose 5-phosphate isomerase B
MVIHLATDHAGFSHKEAVVSWLQSEGYEVVDHGAKALDAQDDFPDFIQLAAKAVSSNPKTARGIIFGGSGQGEAMVANVFPNVRATVYYGGDESIPALSRQHNDANVLSIGARFVDIDATKKVIWDWLHTSALPDEKYRRRNLKIEHIISSLHI